jgi:hypothetical protein
MSELSSIISVEINTRKKIVFTDNVEIKRKTKEDKDAINFIFATKRR